MKTDRLHPLTKVSLIALTVVGLLNISGCEEATASVDSEKKQEEVIKVPVAVTSLQRQDIANYYASNATLESPAEADVISKVQGLIEKIYAEEGDYVRKGQVLAELDSDRYQLVLQQREADLRQVKSELDRINAAKSKNLVSADQLEKLQWRLESLEASTELAQLDVNETKIVAPISGFVSKRYAKVGNLVHQYQHQNLYHIVAQDKLEGVLFIPESRFKDIKLDQPVQLSLSALNNKTFDARIARISPVIDANNGTFKVVVQVDNSQGELKPGMFAEVNIQLGLHKDALVAPSNAVLSLDNNHMVYQVIDGKAVKTDITMGYQHQGMIEVLSGLEDNSTLIIAGHNNLKDKADVTIVENN
ncbi:efflux RND transporter periplasmic adaptor subunit [Psychrosphaera ytuae]|uniref:Efflux RND transporter periplasmic adaptor subunit n=1 Tax=Psychrosphaera ytuae TaxID=2820710 RepID=A0A975DBF6_9GAMM|nr:efflux RND transporter periplasmic adaptor subunit [Psychrosphaera ytuae]QTH64072.1 efflux RND transporter periplasmic adaptor subunit [Psychrosphaera ytuae]